MRALISGLMMAAAAAAMFGCASDKGAKPASQSNQAAVDTKLFTAKSHGSDVLTLTTPADTTCTAGEGSLQLKSQDRYVEFWLVYGAKTVDEGVARLGPTIESEFKEFKPTSTTQMTVAGAPATRLMGTGAEADDGDPGRADIVVFQVGGRIFVACTHEESLKPAAEEWMLELLRTTRQP